jgi:hypothetical protein
VGASLVSTANARLASKDLPGTNTSPYLHIVTVTKEESFKTPISRPRVWPSLP